MTKINSCLWCDNKALEHFTNRLDGVEVLECPSCKLVMLGEIPDNLQEHYYTEDYYTAHQANAEKASGYGEFYDLMAPAFLMWQQALVTEVALNPSKESTLLEVGCATGSLLDIFRELSPQVKTTGIDLSDYAVWATQQKGHDAHSTRIEDFESKGYDVIFSSETLEHLEDLRGSLKGIKRNLKDTGTFLFYVPSISRDPAKNQGEKYVRFTNNLEHILHFTPEFLELAMSEVFETNVSINELDTGFGPFIIGAVSSDKSVMTRLKDVLTIISASQQIKSKISSIGQAVIALKFGKFELAHKIMASLPDATQMDLDLVGGVEGYHKGELIKSNEQFENYLAAKPNSLIAIRSLLANERLLRKMFEEQLYAKINEAEQMKSETQSSSGRDADMGRGGESSTKLARRLRKLLDGKTK